MMYRKENILTGFETGEYNDSPYFIYIYTHAKPVKKILCESTNNNPPFLNGGLNRI